MFGDSGAHDLGYAANAILIALMRKLVSNGTLSQDQISDLVDDAASILAPSDHIGSIAGAMRLLDDIKFRVAA